MTTFDEREKSFENKYQHDQEIQFKVHARRDKLVGLWAASRLGLSGAAAETYARDVVVSDLENPSDEDLVAKILKDFQAKGVSASAAEIRKELEHKLPIAKQQVLQAGS
jgi:hypothetical protein